MSDMPSASIRGRAPVSGRQRSAAWLQSAAVGIVGGMLVLRGQWKIVVAGSFGIVAVLVAIAHPLNTLIGWMVFAPELSPYAQLSLPSGLPDVTALRIGVGLVIGALAVQAVVAARALEPPGTAEKTMLFFTLVVMIDLLLRSGNLGSEGLIYLDEYGTPFLLYYAARNLFRGPNDRKKLLHAMAVLGLVLSLHGIYQYATHTGPSAQAIERGDRVGLSHADSGRAAGPFFNAVEFGGVVGLAFCWTLLLSLFQSRPVRLVASLSLSAVMAVAIVLSLTRSVWIGWVLALVVVAILERRVRLAFASAFVLATTFAILAVAVLAPDMSRLEERVFSMEPIYTRLVMYRAALSMSLERPIAGYGRGEAAFIHERERYLEPVGNIPASAGLEAGPPHDVYLYILLQWGLLGLVPYLLIFAILIRRAMAVRVRSGSKGFEFCFATFFLATTMLYLIQGLFVDVVALPYFSTFYFIGAGALGSPGGRDGRPTSGELG